MQTQRERPFAALLVIGLAIVSFIIVAYALPFFFNLFNPQVCAISGNMSGSNRFSIMIDSSGYNGSSYHVLPWPKMNVTLGQSVMIHVLNNDTVQAHGWAITHYFAQGVALRPGQSCDVAFNASQAGTFQIYNTIVDTTEFFEHAQLNVAP